MTTSDLDYVGDIWEIEERDDSFDAILCTEVFEHISLSGGNRQGIFSITQVRGQISSNCTK